MTWLLADAITAEAMASKAYTYS